MTVQMLPIQKIGKILSSNQWTEELPHGADESGSVDHPAKYKPFLPSGYTTIASTLSEIKALAYIHLSEQIPSNHSTEIETPPPNSVC